MLYYYGTMEITAETIIDGESIFAYYLANATWGDDERYAQGIGFDKHRAIDEAAARAIACMYGFDHDRVNVVSLRELEGCADNYVVMADVAH